MSPTPNSFLPKVFLSVLFLNILIQLVSSAPAFGDRIVPLKRQMIQASTQLSHRTQSPFPQGFIPSPVRYERSFLLAREDDHKRQGRQVIKQQLMIESLLPVISCQIEGLSLYNQQSSRCNYWTSIFSNFHNYFFFFFGFSTSLWASDFEVSKLSFGETTTAGSAIL